MAVEWVGWAVIGASLYVSLFWLLVFLENKEKMMELPDTEYEPGVTVIIPAYNEEDIIGDAITSAVNLEYPSEKLDIVVVNDGSTDNTRQIAEEHAAEHSNVTVINQENKGKGHAVNTGIDAAETETVAVLDADTTVSADSLQNMVGFLDDEDTGAVINAIMPLETETLTQKMQRFEYMLAVFYRKMMSLYKTLYVTPGAFSLYNKTVLEDIGRFDADNITEDLEIAYRLKRYGYDVAMCTPAKTLTEFPRTVKALYRQRMRWYRGMIYNTFKHKKMLFNREYGFFGMFQMPLNIVFPVLSVVAFAVISWGIGNRLYDLYLYLSAVGFEFRAPWAGTTVTEFLIGANLKAYFPIMLGVTFTFIILYTIKQYLDEEFEHPIGLAAFFLLYYAMLSMFWLNALIQEIFKTRRKW